MIDGNAIFDKDGLAQLGDNAFVVRDHGRYRIFVDIGELTQDELYNLGLVLTRLAEGKGAGLVKSQ